MREWITKIFDAAAVSDIEKILYGNMNDDDKLIKLKLYLSEHKDYLYLEYDIDYAYLAFEIWKQRKTL